MYDKNIYINKSKYEDLADEISKIFIDDGRRIGKMFENDLSDNISIKYEMKEFFEYTLNKARELFNEREG